MLHGLRFVVALAALALSCTVARANDVYIAQTAAGAGTGADCADAHAYAFFNTAGNWGAGAGKIGPGTTVHLCGVIASTLQVQGDGSAGNPVIVLAESGAKLSQPAGVLVFLRGHGYLTLDGGVNGIMENTLNGTAGGACPGGPCQYQQNIQAVNAASGTPHDIEIRNWTIQNLYVHSSSSDTVPSNTSENAVFASGLGGNFSFHDNIVHDGSWLLRFDSFNGTATLNIYNNYFYNNDHDVAIGGTAGQTFTASIHDNHSGSKANWDAGGNYHHDGIHITPYAQGCLGLYIYNNQWDGNWGNATTAYVYMEVQLPNVYVFNNVGLQQYSSNLTNGMLVLGLTGGLVANNTFVGDPTVSNVSCLTVRGTNLTIENNAIFGCNQYLSINGPGSTISLIDYNLYGTHGAGGGGGWYWQTSSPNAFSNWQSACSCDAHSANEGATGPGASPSGVLKPGSADLVNAVNLSGISAGYLSPLASDTSAGNSRVPVARRATGSWGVGAYEAGLAPPTGLGAVAR